MKKQLLTLLSSLALTAAALAHGDVELGPNGGRILEFSKNETTHGEVTAKDGKFHIAVLDKEMKPVALAEQTLTASGGPTGKAEKLTVEKVGDHFVVPMLKGDNYWMIFQFRPTPAAKPVTARMQYDAAICAKCKKAEWLCDCQAKEAKTK